MTARGGLRLSIALIAFCGVAAPVQARSLGWTYTRVFTDQQRFVVTEPQYVDSQVPAPETYLIRVADLRTGATRTYALPCAVAAMGLASPVLLRCVGEDPTDLRHHLLFPRTGELRPLPTADAAASFQRIGRHWLGGAARCAQFLSGWCDVYLNWRTGKRRVGGDPYLSKERDLDAADLRSAAAVQRVGRWRLSYLPWLRDDQMVLEHRGRTIARESRPVPRPQLTRRAATWSSGSAVHVRPLGAERTFERRVDRDDVASVFQVGRTIVHSRRPIHGPERVRAVSLPFIRRHWRSSG